jgi:hypothetical protein
MIEPQFLSGICACCVCVCEGSPPEGPPLRTHHALTHHYVKPGRVADFIKSNREFGVFI